MSDFSQGPGWWQASDGKWYPPESQPAQPTQPVPPAQPMQPVQAPPGYPPPQQPPYQPYPSQPSRKTNGLAIAALICALLWGFGLLALAAVILGFIAKRQISQRNEGGSGLATAGIIIGGIGILGAIASIVALVALSDEIEDFARPATVRIEAAEDVCWTVSLEGSDSDISGTFESGCGDARFSLGTGIGREATVTNETGPGSVDVTVSVDGKVRDRGSAAEAESVTVSP